MTSLPGPDKILNLYHLGNPGPGVGDQIQYFQVEEGLSVSVLNQIGQKGSSGRPFGPDGIFILRSNSQGHTKVPIPYPNLFPFVSKGLNGDPISRSLDIKVLHLSKIIFSDPLYLSPRTGGFV